LEQSDGITTPGNSQIPPGMDEFQIRSMGPVEYQGEVQKVVKEIISYHGFPESEHLLDESLGFMNVSSNFMRQRRDLDQSHAKRRI
jgi:hypothetical protein